MDLLLLSTRDLKKLEKKDKKAQSKAANTPAQASKAEEVRVVLHHTFMWLLICNSKETSTNCGDLPLIQSTTKTEVHFVEVGGTDEKLDGKEIHVRARIHNTRGKGTLTFCS